MGLGAIFRTMTVRLFSSTHPSGSTEEYSSQDMICMCTSIKEKVKKKKKKLVKPIMNYAETQFPTVHWEYKPGSGNGSVLQHLPNMPGALGLIPSTKTNKQKPVKKSRPEPGSTPTQSKGVLLLEEVPEICSCMNTTNIESNLHKDHSPRVC